MLTKGTTSWSAAGPVPPHNTPGNASTVGAHQTLLTSSRDMQNQTKTSLELNRSYSSCAPQWQHIWEPRGRMNMPATSMPTAQSAAAPVQRTTAGQARCKHVGAHQPVNTTPRIMHVPSRTNVAGHAEMGQLRCQVRVVKLAKSLHQKGRCTVMWVFSGQPGWTGEFQMHALPHC